MIIDHSAAFDIVDHSLQLHQLSLVGHDVDAVAPVSPRTVPAVKVPADRLADDRASRIIFWRRGG